MSNIFQPLEALKAPYYNSLYGTTEEISVLDGRHCQNVFFQAYASPPKVQPETNPVEWNYWVENIATARSNLNWLLKLSFQKFWSQVINNPQLLKFLDSYLKFAPRFHESSWPDDVAMEHSELHRMVYLTYIRLAANKESHSKFMTREYFGRLIYERCIFDVPKLMDISALYGDRTNCELLSRAVSNIFKCQPKYNGDLKVTTGSIVCTIQRISDNFHEILTIQQNEFDNTSLPDVRDIIMFTSDTSFTLERFLVNVYPAACYYFLERINDLIEFYATAYELRTFLGNLDDLFVKSNLISRLKNSRFSILSVVRKIVNECALEPSLRSAESGDDAASEQYGNHYLDLLSGFMERGDFYHDFISKMPIASDITTLIQACPSIDEERVSYLLQSVRPRSALKTYSIKEPETNGDRNESTAPNVRLTDQPEITSLISVVRDVLPEVDESRILSTLLSFEKDVEKTIHALLEGIGLDFGTDVQDPTALTSDISLLNLHQGNRTSNGHFDLIKSHRGKRNVERDSLPADFKHMYDKYSLVADDEGDVIDDTYDDEYDDTYDGLGIDANDVDDNDEILKRRPFVTPRVFLQGKKSQSGELPSHDEDEEESCSTSGKAKHSEHPTKNKIGGKQVHRPSSKSAPSTANQRKKKDANKAKLANHNRKFMAAKKASKGMGPT